MSIIYDALKKVEGIVTASPKTNTGKGLKPKTGIYLLYVLTACFVLFLANYFYVRLEQRILHKNSDIVPKAKAPLNKKNTLSTNLPSSAKETPPLFTLNGVFFSGEEGYALINNRFVRKGDKIEGATVVQILLDEVELESGSSIIKLSSSAANNNK